MICRIAEAKGTRSDLRRFPASHQRRLDSCMEDRFRGREFVLPAVVTPGGRQISPATAPYVSKDGALPISLIGLSYIIRQKRCFGGGLAAQKIKVKVKARLVRRSRRGYSGSRSKRDQ